MVMKVDQPIMQTKKRTFVDYGYFVLFIFFDRRRRRFGERDEVFYRPCDFRFHCFSCISSPKRCHADVSLFSLAMVNRLNEYFQDLIKHHPLFNGWSFETILHFYVKENWAHSQLYVSVLY